MKRVSELGHKLVIAVHCGI